MKVLLLKNKIAELFKVLTTILYITKYKIILFIKNVFKHFRNV